MRNEKPIVISVTNFKGGTTKTTTSVNLVHRLADLGYRVLGIDLDAQANFTDLMGLELEPKQCLSNSLRNSMVPVVINRIKENTCGKNGYLDVIGAETCTMMGIESELLMMMKNSEHQLYSVLFPHYAKYDFVVLDLAPAMNKLSVNAYNISDRILVPVITEYLSASGFFKLEERLQEDMQIKITDLVISRHENNTRSGKLALDELKTLRGNILMDTIIPKNIDLAEMGNYKQPIFDFSPESKGAKAYVAFVDELLTRILK